MPARLLHVVCSALMLVLLSGCALTPPAPSADVVTNPPVAHPAAAQAAPAPTRAPAAAPTSPPALLDVAAQEAAMRPANVADLADAPQWDSYVITATLLPETLTIAGQQRVAITNRDSVPFQALYFHLYPNHSDFSGSLRVENVRVDERPAAFATEQNGVLLRINLTTPLLPGARTVVALDFAARTPQNASSRAYGAFNREAGVWALASFYPVLARRFNQQWDRRPVSSQGDLAVTETALYDVRIDTPPAFQLVATGTRIAQQQLEHGPRRERFVSGPQRDFFLAALSGLDQASTTVDGTRVVSYYQRGNAAAGQQSLEQAAQAVQALNARVGGYPLAEIEVIQAALTRFLGVEYPGVMLIEQRLYQEGGRTFETTIVHEIAHQWWYSQVGNDVQGEPWLDEGLTSYMQVLFYESVGNNAAAAREVQFFRDQYAAARRSGRDGSIGQPVAAYQGNYVALVYAKGALFFHALRAQLGDELFAQFLQEYYTRHIYDEANGAALLETLEDTCACDMQAFYDAWVYGPGPVEVP